MELCYPRKLILKTTGLKFAKLFLLPSLNFYEIALLWRALHPQLLILSPVDGLSFLLARQVLSTIVFKCSCLSVKEKMVKSGSCNLERGCWHQAYPVGW